VEARYPKVEDRRRRAVLVWPDGFSATVPQYQRVSRLPHDLEHHAVDAILRPRWGFWELVAAKAPFSNVTPSRPWPRERVEWFERIVRHHRDAMVEAERLTGLLPGQTSSWQAARRALRAMWTDRSDNPRPQLTINVYQRMGKLHGDLPRSWAAWSDGDWLSVTWPPGPAVERAACALAARP
jgi:hypothetical protein